MISFLLCRELERPAARSKLDLQASLLHLIERYPEALARLLAGHRDGSGACGVEREQAGHHGRLADLGVAVGPPPQRPHDPLVVPRPVELAVEPRGADLQEVPVAAE